MSCLVCYRNRWRNGEIIAVSDEAPQFSAEYTQDDSPQLFTRTVDDDGEKTWDNDLGTAYEYNFIGILGHNFTSGTIIIIEGADDEDFDGPDLVTDELTYHANWLYEILDTTRTKRFVRVSIENANGNPSGYFQIGTIIIGKAEYFNRNPSLPGQLGQKNDTEVEYSPSGNFFTISVPLSATVNPLPAKQVVLLRP